MFFIGIGTAVPPQRYEQVECWEALRQSGIVRSLKPRSQSLLEKVLSGRNGIRSRHLALEPLSEVFDGRPDTLHARFARHAPVLAVEAARRALIDARSTAAEIDAVLISTCTGYLCPGLTSYVSEALGLREDVLPLDLVGQGCGAALPGFRTAESLLGARRASKVLSICVEVCSAAFYLDDDPGVLISACLFGDGAGAAVLAREPLPDRRRVQWRLGVSSLQPAERDRLRFTHRNGLLRNVLTPEVSGIAARACSRLLADCFARGDVTREQITGWILHTGGRNVIQALQGELDLNARDVRHSTGILEEFGNLSSPTVYFVLEHALRDAVPDGCWWMSAFGAGFSTHGALLEVRS